MPNRIEVSPGARYGRLVVIDEVEPRGKYRRFLCRCDCGKEVAVTMNDMRSGNTKSCGCLHTDAGKRVARYNKIHLRKKGVATQLLRNKVRKDSTTGIKGVYLRNYNGHSRYTASIGFKGKEITLGTFDTLDEAKWVRARAEEVFHKPYIATQGTEIKENPNVPIVGPLAGHAEAAQILGWDKRRVGTYIARGAFPEPIQRLASGPIWTRKQIEDYRDSKTPTNR